MATHTSNHPNQPKSNFANGRRLLERTSSPSAAKTTKTLSATIIAIIVCIQIIVFFGGAPTQVDALYIKERNANAVPQVCSHSMPCGWEVYKEVNKQIRTSNYFVYSPCKCPENSKCVRDSDDVSINSYVHRCKPNRGNEDNNLKKKK